MCILFSVATVVQLLIPRLKQAIPWTACSRLLPCSPWCNRCPVIQRCSKTWCRVHTCRTWWGGWCRVLTSWLLWVQLLPAWIGLRWLRCNFGCIRLWQTLGHNFFGFNAFAIKLWNNLQLSSSNNNNDRIWFNWRKLFLVILELFKVDTTFWTKSPQWKILLLYVC